MIKHLYIRFLAKKYHFVDEFIDRLKNDDIKIKDLIKVNKIFRKWAKSNDIY